jgi:hypothetical protein
MEDGEGRRLTILLPRAGWLVDGLAQGGYLFLQLLTEFHFSLQDATATSWDALSLEFGATVGVDIKILTVEGHGLSPFDACGDCPQLSVSTFLDTKITGPGIRKITIAIAPGDHGTDGW